jgi:spermidine/putrescine transport system substrate-binding protein
MAIRPRELNNDTAPRRPWGKLMALLAVLAATAMAVGCGGGQVGGAEEADQGGETALAKGDGVINVLTWETYHDDPWIAPAEKDLGLKINVTRAGSVDELFAKAQSGTTDWDLYLVDSGSIKRYQQAGLIAPVDQSKLDLSNVNQDLPWNEFNVIDGELWAVPYNWGTQPLIFDPQKVPEVDRETWDSLWDPKYKGQVMIPDDAYITLLMVALDIGIEDPFNWTEDDFAKVKERLDELRPQVRSLTASFNDQENAMSSGENVIGYAQQYLFADKYDLGLSFPEEGVPFWLDNYFFSPKAARDLDVYEFVNYTMQPEWQCRFSNETNQNGVLAKSVAENCFEPELWQGRGGNLVSKMSPDLMARMVLFRDVEDFDRRLELWNRFKAGL